MSDRNSPDVPRGTRRGRPRVDEPLGSSVSAWLKESEHDQLIHLAKRQEVSLSQFVRGLVIVRLRQD